MNEGSLKNVFRDEVSLSAVTWVLLGEFLLAVLVALIFVWLLRPLVPSKRATPMVDEGPYRQAKMMKECEKCGAKWETGG